MPTQSFKRSRKNRNSIRRSLRFVKFRGFPVWPNTNAIIFPWGSDYLPSSELQSWKTKMKGGSSSHHQFPWWTRVRRRYKERFRFGCLITVNERQHLDFQLERDGEYLSTGGLSMFWEFPRNEDLVKLTPVWSETGLVLIRAPFESTRQ